MNPFLETNETDVTEETEPEPTVVTAPQNPFAGIIAKCFETHLNIYIESQDRWAHEFFALQGYFARIIIY